MSISLDTNFLQTRFAQSKSDTKSGKLQSQLSTVSDGEATDEEMMEACKEFEAYFVEKVFSQMKKAMTTGEEEENEYLSYFGEMQYQEYAKRISENGELGLAKQLYESMKRNTVTIEK